MKTTINKDTKICLSLSARPGNFGTRFQNYLYEKLNLDFVYKGSTTTDIGAAVKGIRALGIRGSAISMPFKESCMEFLDAVDSTAVGIESVNTIVNDNGKLTGFNTDFIAVRELLIKNQIPAATEFALAGSGGMAKALACALRDIGFKQGAIISRNEVTGRNLAEKYGFSWSPKIVGSPKLLVNATPVGMGGGPEEDKLSFTEDAITDAEVIFEVVAKPVQTPLVRAARRLSKKVISGDQVIVLQAVEQFVMYTGIRPDAGTIAAAARFALEHQG